MRKISLPFTLEELGGIRAGDWLSLSGVVYTARDEAHRRMTLALARGESLPFPAPDAVVYYTGPSPAPPRLIFGSAGPTSSYRMDPYTPALLAQGVKAFIGKGPRSPEVRQALVEHQALYLAAVGGAAALLSRAVREARIIAYPELGPEAVRRLRIEDMELVCINDARGGDWYVSGQNSWRSL
ncbi:MAG: fumarate hydratase C-terminal domain-containing protein [Desulfarculales bacterium]|jgi:fumarate hydratase subunit beta|nr:fumarate hydratase C-terminal domain-containing protein [Desulfarculales bacterium]